MNFSISRKRGGGAANGPEGLVERRINLAKAIALVNAIGLVKSIAFVKAIRVSIDAIDGRWHLQNTLERSWSVTSAMEMIRPGREAVGRAGGEGFGSNEPASLEGEECENDQQERRRWFVGGHSVIRL